MSTHFQRPPARRSDPPAAARSFPRPRAVPRSETVVQVRPDRWQERLAALVRGLDLALLAVAVAVGTEVVPLLGGVGGIAADVCAVLALLLVTTALALSRAWDPQVLGTGTAEFRRVGRAVGAGAVVLALTGLALQADSVVRPWVFAVLPAYGAAALLARHLLRRALHHRRRRGGCMLPVLAAGSREAVRELIRRTRRDRRFGWTVVAACTAEGTGEVDGVPVVGGLDAIAAAARRTGSRVVAVTPTPGWGPRKLHELSWELEGHRTELAVDPGLMETAGPRLHITPVDGMPLVRVSKPRLTGGGRLIKDGLDRAGALVVLLLTAPLLAAAAAALAVDGGPVLVREPRLGAGGRTYPMLRFRTTGPAGRLLHRSTLDGLPQLLNVLTGSMSLVGPRPLRPDEHTGRDGAAARRLLVRPGMTGLGQVLPGSAEPAPDGRHPIEPALGETVRLVLRYLEIWSLTLDAAILWKTLAAAVRGTARPPRRST